jgi:hypothetical protein
LLIGPRPSHATDLIDEHEIGWQVDQGAVADTVSTLRSIVSMPSAALAAMGERARAAVRARFSKEHLCNAFCDVVEDSLLSGYGVDDLQPDTFQHRSKAAAETAAAAPTSQVATTR